MKVKQQVIFSTKRTIANEASIFLFYCAKCHRVCMTDYCRVKHKRKFNIKHEMNDIKENTGEDFT